MVIGALIRGDQTVQITQFFSWAFGTQLTHLDFHLIEFGGFTLLLAMVLRSMKMNHYLIESFFCSLLFVLADQFLQCLSPTRNPGIAEIGYDLLAISIMSIALVFIDELMKISGKENWVAIKE